MITLSGLWQQLGAVFTPAGDVVVNTLGMNMAGKIVGAGAMPDAPFNCIACHSAAPGDDFVFLHDADEDAPGGGCGDDCRCNHFP